MDELLAWLQVNEGPLAYAVLAAAALIEYVIPPFPGDTVSLFGVFLASTAGFHIGWVYLSLNVGALAGGMTAYGFGRWWANVRIGRQPRFLRSQQARRAIDAILTRFDRHGAAYLALNRFVPAFRGFFFVAAGLVRIPAWKVALWGTVSALVWNALILALGWVVGAEFETLEGYVSTYSYVALAVIAVAIGVALFRGLRPSGRGADDDHTEPEDDDGAA